MGAAKAGSPALIPREGASSTWAGGASTGDLTHWRGNEMGGLGQMLSHPAQPHPCVAGPSTGLPTGRRTSSCPSPWPRVVPAGAELTATRSAATEVRGCCAYLVPALALPPDPMARVAQVPG